MPTTATALEAQALIPNGVEPGGKFIAVTPDHQRVEITVPRNACQGQMVSFYYRPLPSHAGRSNQTSDGNAGHTGSHGGGGGHLAPYQPLLPKGAHLSDEDGKVVLAAWYFENALEGKDLQASRPLAGEEVAQLRKGEHRRRRLRGAYDIAAFVLLMLQLFECPLWCKNWEHLSKFVTPEERCPLPDKADPELSGVPMLPPLYALSTEGVCLAICAIALFVDIGTGRKLQKAGVSGYRDKALQPELLLVVVLGLFVDLAVYCVVQQSCFRFAPYGRCILILYWRRVMSIFYSAWSSLKQFHNIVIMLLTACLFVSWVLAMLLDDIRDRNDKAARWVVGGNFDTFAHVLTTMFSMMCGSGFPDRADRAMLSARWTPLIFVPFQILTYFLLTQLMLAIVLESYNEVMEGRLKDFIKARSMGVSRAFVLLASHGTNEEDRVVSLEVFRKIIVALRENPKLKKTLREDNAHVLFAALDDDANGVLNLKEFFDASSLMLMHFWLAPTDSILQRKCHLKLTSIKHLVSSGLLDWATDITLVVNVVFIIVESIYDMRGQEYPWWIYPLENFFSVIYVLDVMLKLSVTSFSNYWASDENRFDFVVSWGLFLAGISTMSAEQREKNGHVEDIVRYLNILRFVRLLKVFARLKRFRTMCTCIKNLCMVSFDTVMLLLLTAFFFGAVGMQIAGGKLYSTRKELQGLAFVGNGYDIANFNDMTRSLLAVFVFWVNNLVPEYGEAFDAVNGTNWGILYCAIFYFAGCSICLNIFSAFTINVFVTLKNDAEDTSEENANDEDKNLQTMREMSLKEGNTLHVSIPPEVLRMRVNKKTISDFDDVIEKCRTQALQQAREFHLHAAAGAAAGAAAPQRR